VFFIYGVVGMEFLQFVGEDVGVGGGELTRSRPLARPSRAFGFAQIPFAVSQTAQVAEFNFSLRSSAFSASLR
jgi:hypothetical protein